MRAISRALGRDEAEPSAEGAPALERQPSTKITEEELAALREANERALEFAQAQERRAIEAEAELREARGALRELATQLPVCEQLVADLRADSGDGAAADGAGAGRVADLEEQLALAVAERDHMRVSRDRALADLAEAREEMAQQALKQLDMRAQLQSHAALKAELEEARQETERVRAQASRALTLASRSSGGADKGGEGSGVKGRDLLASLEATARSASAAEEHYAEELSQARAQLREVEAQLAQQTALVQRQDALLLTYAKGQEVREAEVRAQEELLEARQRQHKQQRQEWQALVARREATLQERQAALLGRADDDEEDARRAANVRRSQRLTDCQRELLGCREEMQLQKEEATTWELRAESRATEIRRLQERVLALEAAVDAAAAAASAAEQAAADGGKAAGGAMGSKGKAAIEKWMGTTGVHVRRAKAASAEAMQGALEEKQMLISMLQAAAAAEQAGEGDSAVARRRENVRRREAERVVRLERQAARAAELEHLLLQKADDAAALHKKVADLLKDRQAAAEAAAAAEPNPFASAAAAAGPASAAAAAGERETPAPRTPQSYRHLPTAQLRAQLVARGVTVPPSASRLEIERLCDAHPPDELPATSPRGSFAESPPRGAPPAPPNGGAVGHLVMKTPKGIWSDRTMDFSNSRPTHRSALVEATMAAMNGGAMGGAALPAELAQLPPPEEPAAPASVGSAASGLASPPEDEAFALQRERLLRMSEEARLAQDRGNAERWRDSRATLVAIACTLRQDSLLQIVFHAFRELLWQRRLRLQVEATQAAAQASGPLLILTSLEEQRRRLMRMLHAAHLENRWHRQFLSRTVHHKLLLLLWCGGPLRTLQRCWMAWGVHMMRVRMAREQRHELHQLAYALRVAIFAQKPLLSVPSAKSDAMQREEELFSGYCLRRAWLGWTEVIAHVRIERDFRARTKGAALRLPEAPAPRAPLKPIVSEGLLGWFKPYLEKEKEKSEPQPVDDAAGIGEIGEAVEVLAVGDELEELRAEKALSVAWLTWRVQTSYAQLRAVEDAEKSALVTSLWKAATSGVMDTQVGVGKVMKGREVFGLDDDSDDSDDDDEKAAV